MVPLLISSFFLVLGVPFQEIISVQAYARIENAEFPSSHVNALKNISHVEHYTVDVQNKILHGHLKQFWKCTGLCPPDPHQDSYKFFTSKDMEQNIFFIGSLPQNGIEQLRIHWLLDLIKVRSVQNGTVDYDFKYLDKVIHMLWKNNLKPMFEIMGNPSNLFSDFENHTHVYLWRDLVKTLSLRYIYLYGIDYVKQWKFETWNEPDHHDFDNLNFTVQGFLNYYDATSEGLKLGSKKLRFGGPGGSCHTPSEGHSPICWALLNHCIRGKNFFTGKKGSRIDFISVHKKGNASSDLILKEEIDTFNYIRKQFPRLKRLPFFNDEADPLKNWSLYEWWRADATYAAMVVKNVLNHIHLYYGQGRSSETKHVNYKLLSNDNAFLSYFPNQFNERTLLARFQINNTQPKYTQFIKKPVYTVMGLLSRQCDKLLHVQILKNGERQSVTGNSFGVAATICKSHGNNQIVVFFYNCDNTSFNKSVAEVHLVFNGIDIDVEHARWASYEVNNEKTNPHHIWAMFGKPAYPTFYQTSAMKLHEGPHMSNPECLKGGPRYVFKFQLPNPGLILINICTTVRPVKKVENVRFLKIRNTSVEISWLDKYNRCVHMYNIQFSPNKTGIYTQLNRKKVVSPSFWYACSDEDFDCRIEGYYRINVVDYWGKRSPYSTPALLN